MRKLFGFLFALVAVLSLASCGGKVEGALTYDEYVAAKDDTEVTIAGYVQARQGWWTDEKTGVSQATFYLQDKDGGYFVYNLPCTEEQYNNDLAVGKHVKVTGIKGSWKGMVEIMGDTAGAEATFESLSGTKVFKAAKADSLNKEALLKMISQKVSFTNLEVVKVDLPSSEGKDIYFDVTDGTTTLTFAVESYLTDKTTDVYKTVWNLKAGDKINCEGFMYVYENPQLHTTSVTVVK